MPNKKKVNDWHPVEGEPVALVLDESSPGLVWRVLRPTTDIHEWVSAITSSGDPRSDNPGSRRHPGFGVWPWPGHGRPVVPMRLEFRYGAPVESATVVFELEGDMVGRCEFTVDADGEIRPGPLTIEAAPNVDDADPFRRVDDGPIVRRQLADWLAQPAVASLLGRALTVPSRRPGRRGKPAVEYAIWAARYVAALRVDDRRPAKVIVDERAAAGESVNLRQVNNAIHRARRLDPPLLTESPPGRAGGELTPEAVEILITNNLNHLLPDKED